MNLKDLSFKKAYSSDSDDIVNDFYIPALEASVEYNRLAGFFSSTSLAIAARGILGLIKNGGNMKLIVSPRLSKKDLEIIVDSYENPENYMETKMLEELENLGEDSIRDHVLALGWMIANKKLEIKVAMVYDNEGNPLSYEEIQERGIFHQKVGILKDSEGDIITFSGSVNESAKGWLGNIEEFKVFRHWEPHEKEYSKNDILKFNRFWENKSPKVETMDIPRAVEEKFIEIAPESIDKINLEDWYKKKRKSKIELYQHQKDAINAWLENGMKGIFEMATGTGKTFAALGCLKKLLEEEKKLITVIACPYEHLVKQWLDAINDFGIYIDVLIADSSNPGWKNKVADYLLDIKNDISEKLVILTTHDTFFRPDFVKIIRTTNEKLFLIVDEVHGIGAPKRRKGLIDNYHFRLGLSATPKRWFDEEGTKQIFDYFGDTVFEFSLKKAINTINPNTGKTYLTPYEYKPYFVELTREELQKYERETEKIAKMYYKTEEEKEKENLFSLLCFKRQEIIKSALNKYVALEKILDDSNEIKHCIVYCSPQQIDMVQDILNKRGIIQHKFTMNENIRPEKKYGGISERSFLLKEFANGTYQALVAMKCLDEGVDVPSAKMAIIMASSGNPKEYIQRRGRILRHSKNKEKAIIYDIIVIPKSSCLINPFSRNLERRIVKKELKRYKEFADAANNTLECLNKVYDIEEKYRI